MNPNFFALFIMSLGLAFALMSIWVMYDLDKDEKKPHKIKKA